MTVPSGILRNKYNCNGVQTNWSYSFKAFNKTDLYVARIDGDTVTPLVVDIDYRVNGLGNDAGGSIDWPISGSPIASPTKLIIKPNLAYKQELKLQNQDTFPPKKVENQFDVVVTQIKQVAEQMERAVQVTDAYDGNAEDLVEILTAAPAILAGATTQAGIASAGAATATTKAAAAAASAAGLNLPPATIGDALKSLRVKSDGSGYELYTAPGGGTGVLKDMNIGQGLENDGASNLRVKLNGATLTRDASGLKVTDAGVGDTQLVSTAVTPGTYTNANLTVNAKGRVTAAASGAPGLTSVSQGNINTATGSVSSSVGANLLLPGGEYGYYPNIGVGGAVTGKCEFYIGLDVLYNGAAGYPYICMRPSLSGTGIAYQRYVTSSKPYDMGDGEVCSFLYLMVDSAGEIVGHYFSDDPPWAYNGPTKTMADYVDEETGIKYRLKRSTGLAEDVLLGGLKARAVDDRHFFDKYTEAVFSAKVNALKDVSQKGLYEASQSFDRYGTQDIKRRLLSEQYEEITHDIKNADMDIVPQPFQVLEEVTTVLVDPYDPILADLMAIQRSGGAMDVSEQILKSLKVDADFIEGRAGPKGIKQVKLKVK